MGSFETNTKKTSEELWCILLVSTVRRQRQASLWKFKAKLVYVVSEFQNS